MSFMCDIRVVISVCYTRSIMQKTYVWDTDFAPKICIYSRTGINGCLETIYSKLVICCIVHFKGFVMATFINIQPCRGVKRCGQNVSHYQILIT